jgi:8-oxo-dGTP pyrophosphatase MutT (NUDIX family)
VGFEPQKFFIGLIEFFSILLPGALLTYLCKDWVALNLGMGYGYPLEGAEAGAVFLFASYLLGHFLFLFGSKLDDLVYDRVRNWTDWGQISRRLAKGKNLSASRLRRLATSSYLFSTSADNAVQQVQRIKARALQGLGAQDAINAFQWSKARLTKDHQTGLLAVERFEADSKFFRSFVVVLGVLASFYAFRCMWLAAAVCVAGISPALWRYIDQRFKSTQQAYWYVLAMETGDASRIPRSDGLTHAGGIVYRREDGVLKFLLVQASNDRSEWVLPKGHIEAGEEPRVTCVREVKEETGHWARVIRWIEDGRLGTETDAPMVRWFLMELAEEAGKWPEENRQRKWLPLTDANSRAMFPETKALLEKAAKQLS